MALKEFFKEKIEYTGEIVITVFLDCFLMLFFTVTLAVLEHCIEHLFRIEIRDLSNKNNTFYIVYSFSKLFLIFVFIVYTIFDVYLMLKRLQKKIKDAE